MITELQDNHYAAVGRPGAAATKVAFEEGSLPLPAGATVISRTAPIPVVSEEGRSPGVVTHVGSENAPRQPVVFAARDPSAYVETVGVRPDVELPVQEQRRQTFPVASPRDVMPQPAARQAVVQPPQPAVQPQVQPATYAPVARSKTKVRLSNPGMGKITTFVDSVGISDSLIILAYVEDGTANIVEPPDCDAENPVAIDVNGQTYKCMYGGWSATLDGRTLVVLVRIPS